MKQLIPGMNIPGIAEDGTFIGFCPRILRQASAPISGTGPTQISLGEFLIWNNTGNSKVYFVYNLLTSIKMIEIKV